ncbi:MAG: hypothetical protein RIS18_126, partial [Actinomycetota bacterium]
IASKPTEKSKEKMDEVTLINIWNAQRKSIAHAQIVSVIIISAVVALIATGQFATAADDVKIAALAAVGTTGILSLISQFAVIREARMIVKDLAKAKSNTGKIIAASDSYLQLTQVVMVIFGIGLFALLASAIW